MLILAVDRVSVVIGMPAARTKDPLSWVTWLLTRDIRG